MAPNTTGHYKTFNCVTCGKECTVWVTPSALKQGKPFKFCSRACNAKNQRRQVIPCEHCGKPFKPEKAQRFCSRDCFARSTRGRKAANAFPETVAEMVKRVYPEHGAQAVADKFKISIAAVQRLAYSLGVKLAPDVVRQRKSEPNKQRMKGAGNPNYRGGAVGKEYGTNWDEQREKARERDGYACQVKGCGVPARTVHHIVPRRNFKGHMEDANDLSNLITVCDHHHNLIECGKTPCPRSTHQSKPLARHLVESNRIASRRT